MCSWYWSERIFKFQHRVWGCRLVCCYFTVKLSIFEPHSHHWLSDIQIRVEHRSIMINRERAGWVKPTMKSRLFYIYCPWLLWLAASHRRYRHTFCFHYSQPYSFIWMNLNPHCDVLGWVRGNHRPITVVLQKDSNLLSLVFIATSKASGHASYSMCVAVFVFLVGFMPCHWNY